MTSSARRTLEEAHQQGRTPWRSSLKGEGKLSVFSEYQAKPGNVVVQRLKILSNTPVPLRLFSIFDSPETLYKYIFSYLKEDERDMHEIVEENQYQKARFDIDVKIGGTSGESTKAEEGMKIINKITEEIKYIVDKL